ncbi:MAG: asparaginyl-tRNA synthetase [Geoglossum simile]|nr:MAG: asparaginyl-tRNA synthetase [Geoglossum simile]
MKARSLCLRGLDPRISHHRPSFLRQISSSPLPTPTIAALLTSSVLAGRGENSSVTVNGFVRSVRKQKSVAFAAIGDGTTVEPLQAVLSPSQADGLATGTSVQLTGAWKPSLQGKEQSYELQVEQLKVLGGTDSSTYPLQKKYHTQEYLRTIPHLRPRTPFNSLLLRLRSHSIARLTSFFAQREFVQTHPPIITSSDCEGAGEVFTVATCAPEAPPSAQTPLHNSSNAADDTRSDGSFFRAPKYLTVSSQLHLEALAQSVGRVWALSPTFRAERSDTSRHLSEFYMLEAELSFVDSLDPIMTLVEDMIRDLVRSLYDSRVGQELLFAKRTGEGGKEDLISMTGKVLQSRWEGILSSPWPRITYTRAIQRLHEAVRDTDVSFEAHPSWDTGLQAEHERFIADDIGKGSPVFVTDYPQDTKAFYMLPSRPESGGGEVKSAPRPTAACFDLLMPEICEVAGGSLREHRLAELLRSMDSRGMIGTRRPPSTGGDAEPPPANRTFSDEDLGNLKWYADLRRWSSVPHGGFGLGFDRLLGYLSGMKNIREVVAFPRWVGRCDC